jgi:MoxR-like ATPase
MSPPGHPDPPDPPGHPDPPDPPDPAAMRVELDAAGYLVDEGLATALTLAVGLGQPLLLEGEPGVGKTEAAKALARARGSELIRLQCYEGVTAAEALYEWNYQRQILAIRLAESRHETLHDADLFTEEFLQERPILHAVRCRSPIPPVLLIDEIDRADDEFEALLFEFLGEASVTVPELGTFRAARRPVVVLTSNRSRELHDALRRRCLYHWIEFPEPRRMAEILRRSVPSARAPLIARTSAFVQQVRRLDLEKAPGLAEAIDWLHALTLLGVADLTEEDVGRTMGALVKTPDDGEALRAALAGIDLAATSGAG